MSEEFQHRRVVVVTIFLTYKTTLSTEGMSTDFDDFCAMMDAARRKGWVSIGGPVGIGGPVEHYIVPWEQIVRIQLAMVERN